MSEVDNLSEQARQNPSEVGLAHVIDAFDALIDRLEEHRDAYEAELPAAEATGNVNYVKRVKRGVAQCNAFIEMLEDKGLDQLGMMRFTAGHMRAAREERLV